MCRPEAGACDLAERCDGVSITCPFDAFMDSLAVCRPAVDACDVEESCTGSSAGCPEDTGLPDGDGDGTCDLDDSCPAMSDPLQADADGDGIGDACDPCSNFLSVRATKPTLSITKLATPPGDPIGN